MKNKKTIIILAILIVLIGGIFLVNNIYQNKNKAEVSKTKRKKQNNLAIMIKEDGATDYTKSNSKDIPKGDYTLNYEKSYCKNNGVIGDYDSSLGKVSFSFVGTDSCFLYFDYKESNALYKTIQKRYNENKTYLGLYTGEESDTYKNKVYYYKDNVQDNNVLFAGFCWKIVRTTETGGVKLIYNGVQTDGSCNNTGDSSQIGTSAFNSSSNSPAYVGYMYNNIYEYSSKSLPNQAYTVFGSSFTYTNGSYTLNDTMKILWSKGYNTINNNHYSCLNNSVTCTSLYYVYYTNSSYAYYITLTDSKSVDDALNEMLYNEDVNTKNSTIKTTIDNWYKNNMISYTDMLEDTVFCNDRSMNNKESNGWNPNGGSTSTHLYFKGYDTSNASLKCTNANDKFTVNSSNGNGSLTYSVGLLTVSEAELAGYGISNYLNSGENFWLGSPWGIYYFDDYDTYARVLSSSGISSNKVDNSNGVRPVISLKPNIEILSGDGSFTSPFVIN